MEYENHAMQSLKTAAHQNGPLCVGLDTDPSYLPAQVVAQFASPEEAVLAYNKALICRMAEKKAASCFKVQIAYYEAQGLRGLEVYAKTLAEVKKVGLLSIADIKRGDIAATASAYAKAHFSGDFEADIITINPYMGFDTLKPFTEYCKKSPAGASKGLFVLLRTSNPGMSDIEGKELKAGGRVLDAVGSELLALSHDFTLMYETQACSPVGAVVGCTEEKDALALRNAYKDIFFLIPGYGAQGGAARIAATLLLQSGGVVNSSRGILCAYKKDALCLTKERELTLQDCADAALRAALFAKEELLSAKRALEEAYA